MTQFFEMAESSDAINSATLSDISEVSHDGYYTDDDDLTLQNYMNNDPQRNYFISQVYVLEEIKTGDGGNSDNDWFDVYDLDNAMGDAESLRSRYFLVEDNGIDQVGD